MFRFGYEDGCYEHISLIKAGEDNRLILRKNNAYWGPVPTPHTIFSTFYLADVS